MSDTEMSTGDLLHTLAALDSSQTCEAAEQLRQMSQTFAEVSDGKTTSYVLGVLAQLLDPG